jgi:hypothetical protein
VSVVYFYYTVQFKVYEQHRQDQAYAAIGRMVSEELPKVKESLEKMKEDVMRMGLRFNDGNEIVKK